MSCACGHVRVAQPIVDLHFCQCLLRLYGYDREEVCLTQTAREELRWESSVLTNTHIDSGGYEYTGITEVNWAMGSIYIWETPG